MTETVAPSWAATLAEDEKLGGQRSAQAVGRISCESIAAYPPGVPTLLPGERISEAVVEHLRGVVAAGARLHGAADPRFETVTVMVDEH